MERAEWLAQMRAKAEALHDHFSPRYWVEFGLYDNETQTWLERAGLVVEEHGTGNEYEHLLVRKK